MNAIHELMSRIRPQILTAILILGAVALAALFVGITEISVGAVTGIVGISNRILESQDKQ